MSDTSPRRAISRRAFCRLTGAVVLLSALAVPPSLAQDIAAAQFVQTAANQLIATMRSAGSEAARRQALLQLVEQDVDVDGIGRFCLGRYWRIASPEQQREYIRLFHQTLLKSITARLGDYQDVSIKVGRATPLNEDTAVASIVNAANKAPVQVQWVVSKAANSFKVVDVIAEGTSLRQTQRSDYTSYLDGHGGNVQTLLDALKRQEAAG